MNSGPIDKQCLQLNARSMKFILPACLAALVAGYWGYAHYARQMASRHLAPSMPQPPNRQVLIGLSHTVSFDGRKHSAIRCDAIQIRKGKLGLLRFGPLKEAVIENARIEIYHHSAENHPEGDANEHPADQSVVQPSTRQEARFDHFFAPQNLEAIGIKAVRILSFEPIEIKLYEDSRRLWQITAEKAVFKPLPSRMAFRGQVVLQRPAGTVQTQQLTWNLEDGSMVWPEKAKAP